MRSRTVLTLRHLAFEDLGLLASMLRRRGFTDLRTHDVGVDDMASIDLDAIDLLVVLGGPIGAHDDLPYPWLPDEVALIRRRLHSHQPLLGICLGAQLMARALGARVAPMPHGQKEIGFAPVQLTAAGHASPLAGLQGQAVLHWHGNQFAMAPGNVSLAATALCPHQAFMPHPAALALQFHLEADPRRIEQWLIGHAGELAQAGVDIPALRDDAARHGLGLRAALQRVLDTWLDTWLDALGAH